VQEIVYLGSIISGHLRVVHRISIYFCDLQLLGDKLLILLINTMILPDHTEKPRNHAQEVRVYVNELPVQREVLRAPVEEPQQ
jgi:hypothetical protein